MSAIGNSANGFMQTRTEDFTGSQHKVGAP